MAQNLSAVEVIECKTPPPITPNRAVDDAPTTASIKIDSSKCKPSPGLGTPDRLKVPKPFKFPERYTSPTDHMMSPISKGLLARSRRGGSLLPPSLTRSKIHELRPQTSQNVTHTRLKMES